MARRRQSSPRRGHKSAEKLNKAVNAELAPLKLERAKFMTQVETDAEVAGAAGHRPRRVLGADQSGHQARPADEGRLRRRAVALPAGAQGGAVRSRLGAHAGVRRNRYRRRRRGGGRDRRAAGAARRPGPGDGGDACAAGRRTRQPAFADFQGRARQGQARRHPRQRARRRPPPRGNRPHAGRCGDHGGGEGRGGAAAARGDGYRPDAVQRRCSASRARSMRHRAGSIRDRTARLVHRSVLPKQNRNRRRQAHQGPGQGRAHAAGAGARRRTTSATIRRTRRPCRTPNTTRCDSARTPSKSGFRSSSRTDSPSQKVGAAPSRAVCRKCSMPCRCCRSTMPSPRRT